MCSFLCSLGDSYIGMVNSKENYYFTVCILKSFKQLTTKTQKCKWLPIYHYQMNEDMCSKNLPL